MQQTITMTVASLALAFFLSFAAVAFAKDDNEEPIVGTPSISEAAALSIAEEAYAGAGTLTDIELEMEGSMLVYAVEYTEVDGNEVDVKINAQTGVVVLIESDKDEASDDDQDDADDADDDQPVVGTPSINEAAALAAADAAYAGAGTFTDMELEMVGDVLVYAVEYTEADGNEVDVKINATTGAVVLIESDKDEAGDDDQEDLDEEEEPHTSFLMRLLQQLLALVGLGKD